MEWVAINNTWIAETEELCFTVRWTRGAWHWRAVYYEGKTETAQFAGDDRQEQPSGYMDADAAMRAAERWYKVLLSGDSG